jgi:hypothetical protein
MNTTHKIIVGGKEQDGHTAKPLDPHNLPKAAPAAEAPKTETPATKKTAETPATK